MYHITELTSSVVDLGIIFNIYITWTFLLDERKEERLLARASQICTMQFTALPNDCCMAKRKARFFTLICQQVFMTGVEYERESCIFVSWTFCVQFTVYCEEYEFRYWYNHSVETFQILNDNKRFIEWWKGHIAQHLSGKAPKMATTNCIGRWICIATMNCIGRWIYLAMLEEKLQWISLNLSDLSTTKIIHVETSSRTLLICITSQLTHKFRRQSKQRQERGKEKNTTT